MSLPRISLLTCKKTISSWNLIFSFNCNHLSRLHFSFLNTSQPFLKSVWLRCPQMRSLWQSASSFSNNLKTCPCSRDTNFVKKPPRSTLSPKCRTRLSGSLSRQNLACTSSAFSTKLVSRMYSTKSNPYWAWAESYRNYSFSKPKLIQFVIGTNVLIWVAWNTIGYTYDGFLKMTENWTVSWTNTPSHPWTLITSSFSHSHFFHLLFNMVAIVSLSESLLHIVSERQLLGVYLLSALASSISHLTYTYPLAKRTIFRTAENDWDGDNRDWEYSKVVTIHNPYADPSASLPREVKIAPALGASGIGYSLLGMICVLWPRSRLSFFLTTSASKFVLVLAGFDLANLLLNPNSHLGHAAHLGGLATGIAAALVLRKKAANIPLL
ncbi:uncharacterized protein LOC126319872 [Schistocerca gregaria]|uniref:uncharacterized protein LOC126319872 n=1 Tax=Schistocerca gregaria TaxID=7010 RepID=UPI00211EEA02|nr:uncharacterized protein LOC126319872 [Schistocerca gregaria]